MGCPSKDFYPHTKQKLTLSKVVAIDFAMEHGTTHYLIETTMQPRVLSNALVRPRNLTKSP